MFPKGISLRMPLYKWKRTREGENLCECACVARWPSPTNMSIEYDSPGPGERGAAHPSGRAKWEKINKNEC